MSEKTKRFWWLKLQDDFFDRTVIKKLRCMAGGDTYTIIYLKMQLLSLRNEGIILFENVEDSFDKELALRLDEAADDVQVTLLFLQKHNLIEIINDGEYMLPEAVKNMDSECDSAARVRNYRERKKGKTLQCHGDSLQCALQSVTCNTEERREEEKREEEKREREEIDKEKDTLTSDDEAPAPMDYQSIMDSFNQICASQPKIKVITEPRKKAIKRASKTVEANGGFESLFQRVERSDFLSGRVKKWICGFDWILKPANLTKILEGNYDGKNGAAAQPDYTDTSRYENTGWED